MTDFVLNQTFESAAQLQQFLNGLKQLGTAYTMVQPEYLRKNHPLAATLKYRRNFFLCKHNSNRQNTQNCTAHAQVQMTGRYLKVVQCNNVHTHDDPSFAGRGMSLSFKIWSIPVKELCFVNIFIQIIYILLDFTLTFKAVFKEYRYDGIDNVKHLLSEFSKVSYIRLNYIKLPSLENWFRVCNKQLFFVKERSA